MGGGQAARIESIADRLAAAVFAAAAAYAFLGSLGGVYRQPQLGIFTVLAAGVGFLVCVVALGRVKPEERRFAMREFAPPDIAEVIEAEVAARRLDAFRLADGAGDGELLLTEAVELLLTEQVELLLTDADRLGPPRAQPSAELELDEILAELGPDSRVVRLFDPAAMPTPAELNSRIERHLDGSPPAPPTDDSQALYDALAELRRALR